MGVKRGFLFKGRTRGTVLWQVWSGRWMGVWMTQWVTLITKNFT